jgi:magnesium-transporting ATPase (P-type)
MAKFSRKESTNKNIHTIPLYDLRKRFEFDLTTGLSSSRAQELLKKRRLEETNNPYRRIFKMSFLNLVQVFSLVIWLSLLCLVLYYEPIGGDSPDITNLVSFGLILICFLTTPLLIVFQEYIILKETLWLEKYQIIAQSKVMRDSNWIKIPSNELVIGDIVEITANQHVPADLRLFSVNGLSFDKSILTGIKRII